ncbi:hypothetical protein SAMN04488067_11734 [Halorubrum xinjiangense]|uniref:Uncharacterized protein n=1 Tax=Halorubrum xinjiangense TaxID=261291 RepID=A0A1G7RVD4_9EURY|nr:hypothetical protein SAMN04488067_11734 [Halorubrum xinjiangense]
MIRIDYLMAKNGLFPHIREFQGAYHHVRFYGEDPSVRHERFE